MYLYIEELMDIFDMDLIDWVGEVIPSVPESPLVPPGSCVHFPTSPKSSQFLISVSAGSSQSLSSPSVSGWSAASGLPASNSA